MEKKSTKILPIFVILLSITISGCATVKETVVVKLIEHQASIKLTNGSAVDCFDGLREVELYSVKKAKWKILFIRCFRGSTSSDFLIKDIKSLWKDDVQYFTPIFMEKDSL